MMSMRKPHRSPPVTIHQIPNTLNLDAFWMPFTANRQFKAEPRLIASAEGMHYTTVDGRIMHAFGGDRKSTRLNSSHLGISYAVFCLKKKKNNPHEARS